jgi:RNA polymerase sigma-70 factor (ECF subfamily)
MNSEDRVQRDAMLRRAVLNGDEDAWRTWYDETFTDLYAYVLWRSCGQRDMAEEVAQETWLTAVRQIRGFDPGRGSLLDWLRGLATNVLRHHLRQKQRRWNRELAAAKDSAAPTKCDDQERKERIAAALDALPERQEAVLRAKYLDGLSVLEIAALWNESAKAVESLLSRARQAFRELYDPVEEKGTIHDNVR